MAEDEGRREKGEGRENGGVGVFRPSLFALRPSLLALRPSLFALALLLPACTSPPSVAPLLRVAEDAMRREAARLEEETKRDRERLDQARATLAAGFDTDLRQVEPLERSWVKDAAEVYAAAREELVRHELALREERRHRADNLRAAAEAQARAIALIEGQDRLITRTTGLDLWRLEWRPPAAVLPWTSGSPSAEGGGKR